MSRTRSRVISRPSKIAIATAAATGDVDATQAYRCGFMMLITVQLMMPIHG